MKDDIYFYVLRLGSSAQKAFGDDVRLLKDFHASVRALLGALYGIDIDERKNENEKKD